MEDVYSSSKVGDTIDHRWYQLPCIQKPTQGLPLPKLFLIHMSYAGSACTGNISFPPSQPKATNPKTLQVFTIYVQTMSQWLKSDPGSGRPWTLRNNSIDALLG